MSIAVAHDLASLAGVVNAATAQIVALTADAIADHQTDEAGMTSPAAWLAWKTGLAPERAGQLVRLAKVRDRYPLLLAAFERGELSADQLTELVKSPEWAQTLVLGFAEIATVTRLRKAIRDRNFEPDPDEPQSSGEPGRPSERLTFAIRDGQWVIRGAFQLDTGRQIESALIESRDRLFGNGDTDATWSEALVDVAQRSLDAVRSRSRRDRYRAWIHLDSNAAATTTDGWRIPEPIKRLLTCDGVVTPVWEVDGVPVSIGRSQYLVPDRTRRVVMRRDRGCRVPGCGADRFVEVHHIVHWEDGGTTDTCNLVCLCPRHHRMHHQGRPGIVGDADDPDGVTFTDARGSPISPGCRPIPPAQLPECERRYEPPPAGRINYDWVGLGWSHPNALARRRNQTST